MTHRNAIERLGSLIAAALAAGVLAAPWSAARADDMNRSMMDFSFQRAANEFYIHVGDQQLLDGAVSGLRAVVRQHGGDPASIKALRVTSSQIGDITELNVALARAAKKTGERDLAYGAIAGMMDSLHDRWTTFLTPQQFRLLNEGLDGGNFPGIGVVIDVDPTTKSLLVQQVLEGGPAQRAGLQPGDIILTVDGKPTQGLTTPQDSAMIRGKAGTTVHLVVQRAGQANKLQMDIVRQVIHQPSVLGRMLNGDIGYVQVAVFGLTTGDELTSALTRLSQAGAKGFIMDLRNNGGGYLNAAIDVSSKFIAEGPIVSIESRTKPLTTFDAEDIAIAPRPLAVLVNKGTASASEITSGAIQEDGAGVLIGTKTFGKGVVQTIYPLPDGSAIKITTARYLTPKGHDINEVGIQPDIASPDVDLAVMGNPQLDTQLQRAITYVQDAIGLNATPPAHSGS